MMVPEFICTLSSETCKSTFNANNSVNFRNKVEFLNFDWSKQYYASLIDFAIPLEKQSLIKLLERDAYIYVQLYKGDEERVVNIPFISGDFQTFLNRANKSFDAQGVDFSFLNVTNTDEKDDEEQFRISFVNSTEDSNVQIDDNLAEILGVTETSIPPGITQSIRNVNLAAFDALTEEDIPFVFQKFPQHYTIDVSDGLATNVTGPEHLSQVLTVAVLLANLDTKLTFVNDSVGRINYKNTSDEYLALSFSPNMETMLQIPTGTVLTDPLFIFPTIASFGYYPDKVLVHLEGLNPSYYNGKILPILNEITVSKDNPLQSPGSMYIPRKVKLGPNFDPNNIHVYITDTKGDSLSFSPNPSSVKLQFYSIPVYDFFNTNDFKMRSKAVIFGSSKDSGGQRRRGVKKRGNKKPRKATNATSRKRVYKRRTQKNNT